MALTEEQRQLNENIWQRMGKSFDRFDKLPADQQREITDRADRFAEKSITSQPDAITESE